MRSQVLKVFSFYLFFSLIPWKSFVRQLPLEAPSKSIWLYFLSCYDGDTCHARDDSHFHYSLRLKGIDAPEKDSRYWPAQFYSRESQEALESYVQGKRLKVILKGQDAYQRWLSLIYVDAKLLNQQLIMKGFAHAYRHPYFPSEAWALEAEEIAKKNKNGLWARGDKIEDPQKYRRRWKAYAPSAFKH